MSGNITRAEAAARSGLVAAESYEIELDLTTGAERFRSTTTVRFASNQPGEPTWLDLIAPEVVSLTINGLRADPAAHYDGARITIPDTAETTTRSSSSPTAPTCTPARACTGSSTPWTTRCTSTPSSRPPTPAACTPASSSPT